MEKNCKKLRKNGKKLQKIAKKWQKNGKKCQELFIVGSTVHYLMRQKIEIKRSGIK
jgi:predicted  nucleic acid-binding Zn ribbon protein